MKILWIVNLLFPEARGLLGNKSDLKASGGWMLSLADDMLRHGNIELYVASIGPVKRLNVLHGERITYYVFPYCKQWKKYIPYMSKVKHICQPDITHIHGTEYPYGLAYVTANSADRVVVSVQGLISVIARYYCAGISYKDILCNTTVWDLLRGGILSEKKNFSHRGILEENLLKNVNHVIGRTLFDKSHICAINSQANYYHCNESLRDDFYHGCWSYGKCVNYSIFLSQAFYPVKGLHVLLEALSIVRKRFPNVSLRIGGGNILESESFVSIIKRSGYGKYIKSIIRKRKLENSVKFIGSLDSAQMKAELLKCNVFICPSSIENSSNSLAEAQLLGVPCIASYVGGTPDMIPNSQCGSLYRFEEVEMLAMSICETFENSVKFDNTIMRNTALARHNRSNNIKQLLEIYSIITSQ